MPERSPQLTRTAPFRAAAPRVASTEPYPHSTKVTATRGKWAEAKARAVAEEEKLPGLKAALATAKAE